MVDITINQNREIELSKGDLKTVSGVEQYMQSLTIRLLRLKGNDFFDVERGIDYFGQIYVKGIPQDVIEGVFRRKIMETPGTKSIEEMNIQIDAVQRILHLSFTVNTEYGIVEMEEQI